VELEDSIRAQLPVEIFVEGFDSNESEEEAEKTYQEEKKVKGLVDMKGQRRPQGVGQQTGY
jgi:hypothetical protein